MLYITFKNRIVIKTTNYRTWYGTYQGQKKIFDFVWRWLAFFFLWLLRIHKKIKNPEAKKFEYERSRNIF